MLAGFRFVDGGRTYVCQPESLEGTGGAWWWFTVSGDTNRYAPFKAESRDTRANVQTRIAAYYTNHLARRAMPDLSHWAQRGKGGPGRPKGPGTAVGAATAGAAGAVVVGAAAVVAPVAVVVAAKAPVAVAVKAPAAVAKRPLFKSHVAKTVVKKAAVAKKGVAARPAKLARPKRPAAKRPVRKSRSAR